MSGRIVLGVGLTLILLVNYLPYGTVVVHGLVGASFASLFIPLLPVLIGIPLVFQYPHRRMTGWIILVGLLISIVASSIYFLRGSSMQTAMIMMLLWGIQGSVMFLGLIIGVSCAHKVEDEGTGSTEALEGVKRRI